MKQKLLPYIVLLGITLLIGFPLLRTQLLEGHDGVFGLFRCYTTKIALEDGQLIPMINPNMMGGFGYATNLFYGILTPYIATLFSYFLPSLGLSINVMVLLTIFLSGSFMYRFLISFLKNRQVAFLGSIIYMTSPYLMYDIYVRMSIGEIVSFVFLPILFSGLYNIINQQKEKWYLLSIGTSGLLLTHTLSSFMVSIFAFLYLLLQKKQLTKEKIKTILFSLLLGILIALPNLLPLLEAKNASDYMVFDSNYMNTTGKNMQKQAIDLISRKRNWIQIIGKWYSILIFGILLITYVKRRKLFKQEYPTVFVLLIISFLLTLTIIPWQMFPSIFSKIQFPWRFFELTSFFLAIVVAMISQKLSWNKKKQYLLWTLCFITCTPFLIFGIHNKGISNQLVHSNQLKFRDSIIRSTGTASAEYLPRNVIFNGQYLKMRGDGPVLLTGIGKIRNRKKEGTYDSFDIELSETSNVLELPYIYYPGYVVVANRNPIKTFETKNGMVGIQLESGKYHIQSYYRGSKIMIFSYCLSFLSIVFLFWMILKQHICDFGIKLK